MPEIFPDRTWLWLATALYALAFGTSTVSMLRSRTQSRGFMLELMIAGFALQSAGLYQRGMGYGSCPLRNTFEVVQFMAWSIMVLHLAVGTAFRVSLLGYFTSGLAVSMSLVSLLMKSWDGVVGPPVFGGNPWIEVHASLGLLAYGAFGSLALTSLMFLLQTFSLKQKRLRGLFAFLPSIVALEEMNFRLLVTGLLVLTFSIVVGGHYYRQDPEAIAGMKLAMTTAVWIAYLVVLALRLRRVLVADALAWTCLVLFVAVLLSLGPIGAHRKQPAAAASAAIERSAPP